MADLETIARQVRDAITSDDESVWLDLPQIMNVARPALSAFFAEKLQSPATRAMFPNESIEISVENGACELQTLGRSYLKEILHHLEIFLGSHPFPVRIVESREQLSGSILDALYLKAFREGNNLTFATDTTGSFGGGAITAAGTIIAPKVSLNAANLPTLLEGEFVAFFIDFVKDQQSKRP